MRESLPLYGPTGVADVVSSDAQITLAFVAKRQGVDSMAASAWAHTLSLELGWMAPGVAKAFITDCQDAGLLSEEGDSLRLAFDRKAIDIPRGFRPPQDLSVDSAPAPKQAAKGDDLFPRLVARIAEEKSMTKDEVMDEARAVQERFGGRLSAEAAAVRVAMAHDVDAAEDAAQALARITSRSK